VVEDTKIIGTVMNILIVDDDMVDRESVRRALTSKTRSLLNVQEAQTVDAALEIINEMDFDVILLDYNMPQRNGIELLIELNDGSNIVERSTIIMMSTDEDDERALECIAAGAQDFLTKTEITPFRLQRSIMNARLRSELEQKLLTSYKKAKELAERDSLTGLANRYFFDESLKVSIANNQRDKNFIALLLIDLDHFKFVNDSYGHDIGDQLLIDVVERINGLLRENELFSRLGGDEFAITLSNLTSVRVASNVASRIVDAFKTPFIVNGIVIQSSLSIGISICPSDSTQAKDLFKYADIAMYRAKKMGRNQFSFFEREMQEKFVADYKMESDLKGAVENDLFTLNYQPILNGKTQQLCGVEALIRWTNAGVFVGPDEFIPIAERSMVIVDIGKWVMNESLKQLAQWNKLLPQPITMSINLSTVQLTDRDLYDDISNMLARHQIPHHLVTFEITETALLAESEQAPIILQKISDLGCKIALDDFGTGFSSLSHLIHFPLDTVKIDKSLMPHISKGQKEAHIIAGLVSMVKSLELELVAEGIEEKIDLDLCSKLEIDRFQGYYFDRPMPENEFRKKYIS